MKNKFLALVLVFCMTAVFAANVAAADTWRPTGTVSVIVTHGAGGDTDYNGRLLSRLLEEHFGVTFVVFNVTGSNGAIAMEQYRNATPDGYTLIMTNTAALVGNEATGLVNFGYDAFEVVGIFGRQAGENIIVPANSPYYTLEDLILSSQANPNTIRFGISLGGGVYIASIIMEESYDAQFVLMDQGDASARMASLLGGHVDATIVPYSGARAHIEAGSVRSLATLLSESPSLVPDIPPASATHPTLVLNTLYAVLAPNGTDIAITQALNDAILYIVHNNEEYREAVNRFNFQDPWALSIDDSITELRQQRDLFMQFAEYF